MNPNTTTQPEPQDGATPDLAAIQARCDAATPGPWEAGVTQYSRRRPNFCAPVSNNKKTVANTYDGPRVSGQPSIDATFIAHARTDIPALLAATEAARREIYDARKELDCGDSTTLMEGVLGLVRAYQGCVEEKRKIESTLRAQLATLTATLAQREAEVAAMAKSEQDAKIANASLALNLGAATAARDTALARVRELEAAMDELRRRLNALETDVYKYQNQCDPEEAIPAYITGEIERISKSASDAAARAGTGEEAK